MKLREWMDQQPPLALARLAKKRRIRLATFYEAAKHGLTRVDVAKRISAATGGAVSAAELLGLSTEAA